MARAIATRAALPAQLFAGLPHVVHILGCRCRNTMSTDTVGLFSFSWAQGNQKNRKLSSYFGSPVCEKVSDFISDFKLICKYRLSPRDKRSPGLKNSESSRRKSLPYITVLEAVPAFPHGSIDFLKCTRIAADCFDYCAKIFIFNQVRGRFFHRAPRRRQLL